VKRHTIQMRLRMMAMHGFISDEDLLDDLMNRAQDDTLRELYYDRFYDGDPNPLDRTEYDDAQEDS